VPERVSERHQGFFSEKHRGIFSKRLVNTKVILGGAKPDVLIFQAFAVSLGKRIPFLHLTLEGTALLQV